MTAAVDPAEITVLIIEDDPNVSQLVRLYLSHEGFSVLDAADGYSGLEIAKTSNPTLILLDLNLPGIDGVKVCTEIRKHSDVPIIMVTARVDEEERLEGLDVGADDYVTKPFSPRELMARIRAVLRRTMRETDLRKETGGEIAVGRYRIDLEARSASVAGTELRLTPTEYRLLTYFLNSHRRTVSRDQIINGAIGYSFEGFDRTVDTHISNLRRKLEKANGGERHLKTVYGVGYRFETT